MNGLRTKRTYNKYQKHLKNKTIGCPLCDRVPLKSFKYWKVIVNNFPYDRIAKEHHMILPLRHVVEDDLNQAELTEYKIIKNTYLKHSDYNSILEATFHTKSQPKHFHLHLIELL